jgi:hypothetical protein
LRFRFVSDALVSFQFFYSSKESDTHSIISGHFDLKLTKGLTVDELKEISLDGDGE